MRKLVLFAALLAGISGPALAQSSTYQRVGTTTYGSNGTSYQHVGNTTYGSNGTTSQQVGTTTYGSNGTTAQSVGNTTYINKPGAPSRTCRTVGMFTHCD